MAAYAFKIAGLFKVDAQTAGAECERLAKTEAGLSPTTLLEASRPENAPCHNCFEWDDDKAAELYRLDQAGKLIRNITIIREEQPTERAFVSVKPNETGRYEQMSVVLEKTEWKYSLLEQALRDLKAFRAKYGRLQELAAVVEEIDKMLACGD